MIQVVPISVEAWREGDFPTDPWQFVDDEGASIDITGWTIWFCISRDEPSLSAPLQTLASNASSGDRVVIDTASAGTWHPSIAMATIAALPLIPSNDPCKPGTRLFCAVIAQAQASSTKEIYAAGPFIVRG